MSKNRSREYKLGLELFNYLREKQSTGLVTLLAVELFPTVWVDFKSLTATYLKVIEPWLCDYTTRHGTIGCVYGKFKGRFQLSRKKLLSMPPDSIVTMRVEVSLSGERGGTFEYVEGP